MEPIALEWFRAFTDLFWVVRNFQWIRCRQRKTWMKPKLLQRFVAIQNALMAHHGGGTPMPKPVKGTERETFLKDFLQKVFPSHYRFTSGAIIDAEDQSSGQIDIAVEYPILPSFPMPGSDERLILAESVMAVIEVKSDLIAQWNEVTQAVRLVKALRRDINPIHYLGPDEPPPKIPYIAIGYTGHKSIEALKKRRDSTDEKERPDAALVIKSGCFEGLALEGKGPAGLYVFCVSLIRFAMQLQIARPEIERYI
jgi:hypothetical protein